MKTLFVLIGMISTTFCTAATVDTIPATNNLIEYTGRIDFSDPAAPTFSYSGVSIRACFTGTSIAMIMNDNVGQNYYNLILDGKLFDTVRISKGKKTYQIASGLENITHEIEIIKRTEEMFGKTQFFGFVVDKASTLVTITNQRTKLIEYIGNSITCGYGNEGVNGGTFGPTTENHYMTYAAFTSRNFNSRHLAVCRSGIGIYRNYDGPATGNSDCMTNNYTRIFLYDENPKYTFSDKPDLVCIDLGTNDFSVSGGDSSRFVSNYFRLIDTIQTKYSMPNILCLLGPMMSDPTLTSVRKYLQFIADSATQKGKGNVYFFEMSAQTGPFGIDYHPTVAQHIKNGLELTEYIKLLKGWKVTPSILSANLTKPKHIQIEFNTAISDTVKDFSGFTISGDEKEYTISSVYLDTENKKLIHIILNDGMNIGEKISISYTPGTIVSADTVLIGAIQNYEVQNNLTETKITKGSTTSNGAKITLTCNKNIDNSSNIDGLTLTDSRGIADIDSFSISNTIITLYLSNPTLKGDSVFAAYTGTAFYGVDEVPLTQFDKLSIKNNSTVTANKSVNKLAKLNVFPNPNSSEIFFYQIDKSLISGKGKLVVISNHGKILFNQAITEAEGSIDLNGKVSKGLYFFKFSFIDTEITKSVIIE